MDYYTKPFYNTSLNQSLYLQLQVNALKHTKNSQDFPTGTPDRRPPHRYNAHRIYSGFNATTILLLSESSMQVQIKPIFKFQFQSSCLQIRQYIDIKELNTESRKLDFFQAVPQPFKLLAARARLWKPNSSKLFLQKQLSLIKQLYDVGLQTATDDGPTGPKHSV